MIMKITTPIRTLLTAALLCTGCAKIVTPTGGPKDTTAPKVVRTDPQDGTVRFNEKYIRIYFDEFVTLNNPTENVLISPPLSKVPDYTIKGKSLVIKFKDTLQPNTTYNMVFSDCIKDYHESNVLNYFHYSFTTGDSLDDYMIRGNILDAKSLAPAKDFYVVLFKGDADSLPLTTMPNYVTKSLSDGSFTLKNITKGDYKIFAIKDINANFQYDLPNEEIAFLEERVTSFRALPNSAADSLKAALPLLTLYAFTAADSVQQLSRPENPSAGIYKFPYKHRIVNFSSTPVGDVPEYFEIINPTHDTVTWYFKSTLTDTATFILTADERRDTVHLAPYKDRQSTGRGRGVPTRKLDVKFLNAGEYQSPLTLQFPYPIRPTDSFSLWVYSQQKDSKDTVVYRYSIPDTLLLEMPLPINVTEKKSYSVMIPDSVFFGYNGLTNDTLKAQFSTKSIKDYGTLTMNYQIPDDRKAYVATLWYKDHIVQEDILTSSKTITYTFLNPDTYRVSVFCDDNGNGRWDPGDYRTKHQPEKMFAFPQNISIRAYWDTEETFVINNR